MYSARFLLSGMHFEVSEENINNITEQRHRIQLDVAYSPDLPVAQQESEVRISQQQDSGPTERISTQEICW